ncbi:sodium-coupled monocarboxylate transporter 1-like [Mizuhopecten yessoensis]|uniref:sodium-coupled monocarboxylate transporter 1-like n=1 Tax=Mizuhopecten yessoensis TaxID=6573 RepID=UPI000B458A1D|nr:sodium-coupled monocarboxylate transporter 1-like [Mizuhopecten yessoensis]
MAANTVEDILGDCVKNSKRISQTSVAKLFVIMYGLTVIGLAYGINSMSGSVIQMTGVVFGACGGPLGGLFFLGGMMPKANWIGAIVGSMTALIFDIWIAVGAQLYGKRPVKLIQNPISGCFPNNLTVAMNASLVNIYNTTMTSTPYDEGGHISMPSNSQVT